MARYLKNLRGKGNNMKYKEVEDLPKYVRKKIWIYVEDWCESLDVKRMYIPFIADEVGAKVLPLEEKGERYDINQITKEHIEEVIKRTPSIAIKWGNK